MVNYIPKLPDASVNYTKADFSIIRLVINFILILVLVYLFFRCICAVVIPHYEAPINSFFRKTLIEKSDICSHKYYYDSVKLQSYINDILRVNNINLDIKICIINLKIKNAAAAPGDVIFVSNELYNDAKTLDDLGFVLAHEISHLIHKDPIRGLHSIIPTLITSALFSSAIDNRSISNIFANFTQMKDNYFTREQEIMADKLALMLLKNKYDNIYPQLLFFEKLLKTSEQMYDNGIYLTDYYYKNGDIETLNLRKDNFIDALSTTHPRYHQRMAEILNNQ